MSEITTLAIAKKTHKKTTKTASKISRALFFASSVVMLSACDYQQSTPTSDHIINANLSSAINSSERPEKDKLRDQRRKPAEILTFFDIKPGMKVLEILAGGGYYTELISRTVGSSGHVYMQNNQKYYEFQTDLAVNQRLADDRLTNVSRWDKELDVLALPQQQLDAAFFMLVFHDLFWMTPSVEHVVNSLYQSIKPGGVVGIVDHAALAGTGDSEAIDFQGKHRIDEALVIDLFTQAGFKLADQSDLLRNPEDKRDAAFFTDSMKGKATDRFVLKFIKPVSSSA